MYLLLGAHLLNDDAADACCSRISRSRRSTPRSCWSPTSSGRSRRRSARAASSSRSGGCPSAPSATGSPSNAPELGEVEATALARVAGGRLDRARRLIDPEVRERRAAIIAAARGPYLDPEFEPADASRALLDADLAARRRWRRTGRRQVVAGLDLPTEDAEQRIKRVQRGAEREELLAQLEELAAWYRDLVVVASGAESATIHADRLDDLRADAARDLGRGPETGGRARAAGVALGRGVQRQHRALARRALRAAPALVRLTASPSLRADRARHRRSQDAAQAPHRNAWHSQETLR